MAKQTFTTGQVLSAAQVNALQANDYNTTVSTKTASYVLVAADVGTTIVQNVATANAVTVNTGLFAAGDTLRIQNIGAGIATVTAGTATVNTANSLAMPQWGSGILYFTSASAAIFFPSAGAAGASSATVGCLLFNNGDSFAETSNVLAMIPYTGETLDTDAFHSNSPNPTRITIPTGKGGVYRINVLFRYRDATATSYAFIAIFKNGTRVGAEGVENGDVNRVTTSNSRFITNTLLHLTLVAGDYIEIGITTDSATQNYTLQTQFGATLLP